MLQQKKKMTKKKLLCEMNMEQYIHIFTNYILEIVKCVLKVRGESSIHNICGTRNFDVV